MSAVEMTRREMHPAPVVSVVVPTCRRPDLLERCLDALLSQRPIAGGYEIIVVDDARSPSQQTALAAYVLRTGTKIPVHYLVPPGSRRGPAAARNAGWQAARAGIIAFTDDDTIPARDWLQEGILAMRPGIDAAWGHVLVPLPARPTDAERNVGGLHGAEFVTANCFVRRDALLQVGGFDERFERPWREDSDLHFTLLESGFTVTPAQQALVVHPARRAPRGTSIRQHRNLLFEALLYKKHPQRYREKISDSPAFAYYLTVTSLLAVPTGLLMQWHTLTVVGAIVWLLLTVRLAIRRLQGTSREWGNVADILISSILIPPVAIFWRLAGAIRFRVLFV